MILHAHLDPSDCFSSGNTSIEHCLGKEASIIQFSQIQSSSCALRLLYLYGILYFLRVSIHTNMSALYNLEPQPTAKVLLETTAGDILLELFAKQTPRSSRNFLQLCLDGYYNGTIFHRLVPGFVIQGGDPTGNGEGGEAIYDGGLFEDEFHSRLKFNRRGLLGMANSGRKDDNGSQFFLTLGPTPELEGRNTMFGRVVGDTIYNLMKMGDAELAEGGGERPMYPTKITRTEVLVNPYEDMVKREGKVMGMVEERKSDKKKGKKRLGKALLSFEAEEGEDASTLHVLKKEKFNTKLVVGKDSPSITIVPNGKARVLEKSTETFIRRGSSRSRSRSPIAVPKPERTSQLPLPKVEEPSRPPSHTPEPESIDKVSSLLERTNAQIADMKASMKRNISSAPRPEPRKKSALEQMIPDTATRGRKRKHGAGGIVPKDAQTLSVLDSFRAKLESAQAELKQTQPTPNESVEKEEPLGVEKSTAVEEEAELCDLHFIVNCASCQSWDKHMSENVDEDDDEGNAWMAHALTFGKDRLGKDLSWKKKNEEDLIVIDPREKTREIMEEHRAKKVNRGPPKVAKV